MRIVTGIGVGLILGIAAPGQAAPPVSITACGQVVAGVATLGADLDCSGQADDAVRLNGRLLMNGFTLTGNPGFDVVRCEAGPCGVVGPGTVTGGLDGVRSDRGARVEAGAIITGNVGDGVRTESSAKVLDATISANGGDGVRSRTRATVQRSTVSGNGGDGVRADRSATVKASIVSGNGGNGVDGDLTAKATSTSVVTGNGFDGLKGLRVVLSNSTATGNGTDPACGVTDECADLAADLKASVKGISACGTSRNTETGGTWGVCSDD